MSLMCVQAHFVLRCFQLPLHTFQTSCLWHLTHPARIVGVLDMPNRQASNASVHPTAVARPVVAKLHAANARKPASYNCNSSWQYISKQPPQWPQLAMAPCGWLSSVRSSLHVRSQLPYLNGTVGRQQVTSVPAGAHACEHASERAWHSPNSSTATLTAASSTRPHSGLRVKVVSTSGPALNHAAQPEQLGNTSAVRGGHASELRRAAAAFAEAYPRRRMANFPAFGRASVLPLRADNVLMPTTAASASSRCSNSSLQAVSAAPRASAAVSISARFYSQTAPSAIPVHRPAMAPIAAQQAPSKAGANRLRQQVGSRCSTWRIAASDTALQTRHSDNEVALMPASTNPVQPSSDGAMQLWSMQKLPDGVMRLLQGTTQHSNAHITLHQDVPHRPGLRSRQSSVLGPSSGWHSAHTPQRPQVLGAHSFLRTSASHWAGRRDADLQALLLEDMQAGADDHSGVLVLTVCMGSSCNSSACLPSAVKADSALVLASAQLQLPLPRRRPDTPRDLLLAWPAVTRLDSGVSKRATKAAALVIAPRSSGDVRTGIVAPAVRMRGAAQPDMANASLGLHQQRARGAAMALMMPQAMAQQVLKAVQVNSASAGRAGGVSNATADVYAVATLAALPVHDQSQTAVAVLTEMNALQALPAADADIALPQHVVKALLRWVNDADWRVTWLPRAPVATSFTAASLRAYMPEVK